MSGEQPILKQPLPETRELTEEEKALIVQQYDNEWIKFLSDIAQNKSVADIVSFIEANQWTDRQKSTIMHYAKIVLGRGLSTTFITSNVDYLMLKDDKALIDCDIPLGMTTYDLTPEFNILMGMIRLHFNIESRKSKGGKFLNSIGKQTYQITHEEQTREKNVGFKEKIGWGGG